MDFANSTSELMVGQEFRVGIGREQEIQQEQGHCSDKGVIRNSLLKPVAKLVSHLILFSSFPIICVVLYSFLIDISLLV